MSYLDLYASASATFGGLQKEFEEAEYVVVGVPFDGTSTYRTGARFAPLAIRQASENIETYSFRAGIDVWQLGIHDAGDVHVAHSASETIRRIELIAKEIWERGKTPVFVGGEHTLTLGAAKAAGKDVAIVSFDAHLDLRDKYLEEPLSHATFMRRIKENVQPGAIIEVGTRAVDVEEIDFAKKAEINYFSSQSLIRKGPQEIAKEIHNILAEYYRIYFTIDMDVLDPAFAPAVQNPEPDGLSTGILLDLLAESCNEHVIGFDLVEVSPHYDSGTTEILAAKIIFEILAHIHIRKKK